MKKFETREVVAVQHCEYTQCHRFVPFILLSEPLLSFMSINLPSLSFSGCTARVCGTVKSCGAHIPTLSYFFYGSFSIWFQFHSPCYHSAFLCDTFIFLSLSPLLMICFCKMSHGFTSGRQEATQLHALLSGYQLNNMHGDQSMTGFWKKWRDWSLSITHICYPIAIYGLRSRQQSSHFMQLLVNITWQYNMATEMCNVFLRD